MKPEIDFIIGIDEVGRGPLAGPVAIGVVCIPIKHSKEFHKRFSLVRDSKKISEKERERWFSETKKAMKEKILHYGVSFVSPHIIDKKRISYCIKTAITRSLKKVPHRPKRTLILLDGGLYASGEYSMQKTIIRGDEKEPLIALAAITAKVMRDRKMKRYAKKYPEYGFGEHKGYGTKSHIRMIKKHGPSEIHRISFLKDILT